MLEGQPVTRAVAEVLCQPQRCAWRHSTLFIHQLVDSLVGHMDAIRQIPLGNTHWIEEFLQKHFAWMRWLAMCRYSYHRSLPLLVVIHNFYVTWTTFGPSKANPVLLVDPNTVLAAPVTRELFQSIAGWDSKILDLLC